MISMCLFLLYPFIKYLVDHVPTTMVGVPVYENVYLYNDQAGYLVYYEYLMVARSYVFREFTIPGTNIVRMRLKIMYKNKFYNMNIFFHDGYKIKINNISCIDNVIEFHKYDTFAYTYMFSIMVKVIMSCILIAMIPLTAHFIETLVY